MDAKRTPAAVLRLDGARRRFERWRRARQGRGRIPERLWASAVEVAGVLGVHKTAEVLRLDYYSLKKRVEGRRSPGPVKPESGAAFVELVPAGSACPPECVLELEDPGGARMRVHIQGGPVPDLASLSRSFWRREA